MKRFLFLLTLATAVLCVSASNRYISPTGNDGDGKSWANAKTTIAAAIWDVGVGDTMFIAAGTYMEAISAQNGATYLGGYDAETGLRDPELYETIIDGTGNTQWSVVKYSPDATDPITLDGFIFQNSNHSTWGGAVMYMRSNMIVSNCLFRNNTSGSKAGAIFVDQAANNPSIIRNCIFENCNNTLGDQAAAISCESDATFNVLIENCVIRGCTGDVMIYSRAGMTVRNCVLYNNHSSKNGCLYGKGAFINCTVANNTGVDGRYAGCRVEGTVVNTVFWGNTAPNAPNVNYVASGKCTNSIADAGSGITLGLATDNNDADGPNFRNPTGFAGVPTSDTERMAVANADFSLTDASTKLLDQGDATQAPATDILGVVRPKGTGVDLGAYEYDPDAAVIAVTGVTITPSSIEIIEGRTGTLVAQVEPADANNKRVTWTIDDPNIATIQNGKITGVSAGTTTARVTTQEGEFTAAATVIITPKPPVKYPHEVVEAEATYHIEDYTIPSFIPYLVAKEVAKIDSMDPDNVDLLPTIPEKVAAMQARIAELQPKEQPYNQIATIYGDPATHMGFCWFTNGGITDGVVQLLPMADATAEDFTESNGVIEVSAQTTNANLHYTPIQASESPKYDICTAAGLPRNTKFDYVSHKAQATTLTPGTVYSWRVGFDGHWSDIAQFITKDANQGDFSFVYMTDSHIQDYEYIDQARQCAEAVVKNEPDAKFCLFPGDFADTGGATNSEWQWEQWFEGSMRPALNKMPFVPTDGNHDDSPSLNYDFHFNTDWGFANAAETKPQFKGITYSFVYGDVLFLVYSLQDWWRAQGSSDKNMKSTYLSKDVANWFKEQIAKHPNTKYRVTLSHKNIFSGAGHHTDDECPLIRDIMIPILKECEIDLAIQGHDHCYEVMGPVDPDTWTVVPGSITDTTRVAPEATGRWERSENKTGLEGGTFKTDEGTLYFIGATCGRKRYEPHNRALMEEEYTTDPSILFDYHHHNVNNLFDLFTTKFGQPGTPSYSRFNVTADGIEVITYKTDAEGNKTVFNTINVKRDTPHSVPQGFENPNADTKARDGEKFIQNGQLFIRKNGKIYTSLGTEVK